MILLAKIALGIAGAGLAGAGVLCSEGVVDVKVIEKQPQGLHFRVIAPAMLAPIAVYFAPQRNLANAARVLEGNPALMNLRLMQSLTAAQNAGNTLVLGMPGGFVPLKNGKGAPAAGEVKETGGAEA